MILEWSLIDHDCCLNDTWLILDAAKADVTLNAICYSAAISAYKKGRQWEQGLSLLSEMRKAGMPPEVINFKATISECVKGRQWEQGLCLLSKMRKVDVTLNVFSFDAAISACKLGRQLRQGCSCSERCAIEGNLESRNITIDQTLNLYIRRIYAYMFNGQ